jgi:tryptophan synthase beta subunit
MGMRLAVRQFHATPRSISSSPGKSAAIRAFRNREKPKMSPESLVIMNHSGRGDKDVAQVAPKVGLEMPK